ncbi:winged helix-turn-helix transcriptional regulator [Clostridium sp. AL.422]|uniref:winged helix-turn-helix transcriptional regulator n=1 Tax=Clostridium TaxID=1485 RepID=UPI00293DF501|nr:MULTISPECIES: winged helix-turn-helix transcriptional regulator [unclassified Clostridium]MDV4150004.1 winged helix-turn-helix transcriptional regulator [Clostridium sp. AL.422]
MEGKFEVLSILIENPNLSQRSLSKKSGISLGKINAILKECIQMNYLTKCNDSEGIKYFVTEKGELHLREKLEEMKDTKLIINDNVNYHVKEAVILAAGKIEDFDVPIATLKINEVTLIKRTIDILRSNGIEKIIVVTGYSDKYLKDTLKNEKNIFFVTNNKYKWTGTMYSLALAQEYITDDFVLVESDLIFENQAISEVVKHKSRDCILITNESGSGDEAFVQLKDGFLFKMAKDIHQFNRIDGEMIGISKISRKLYNMMINEFKNNINPYLNYEYMLLDISRDYKVSCLKIDDLIWGEIDNIKQYNYTKDYLYKRIKRKDHELEVGYIKSIISEYIVLSGDESIDVIPAGGMTNNNYKVTIDKEEYILRVPGAGTENMISRKNEMINSKLSASIGLNVDVVNFDEKTGIKISKFISGAETLTSRSAKKEENMILVADLLRRLHNSNLDIKNTFDVFEEICRYENILRKHNIKYYDDYDLVRSKVMDLKDKIHNYSYKIVPSHNDTVPENFIKDNTGRMYLIDWEYSGLNDEMWDLAAFSLECGFNEEDDELFFRLYFEGEIEKNNKVKILMNKIFQDFLWSIWTLIKEAEGDDFGTYGIERYNRARKNIEILYKII